MRKAKASDWYCPNCGDLIEDEDARIEHLVIRHNVSSNIIELAGVAARVDPEISIEWEPHLK